MISRICCLFLLSLCVSLICSGQQIIEGRVVDATDRKPLAFANVFLSNTTKGQQTDDKGRFRLSNVPSGTLDLVISYVGYSTFSLQLRTDTLKHPLLIILRADAIELQGVTIKRIRDGYKKYFHVFKQGFIGITGFSEACKLKNPGALTFSMNQDDSELMIRAEEPLIIENSKLGYVVKYQLEEFKYHFKERYTTYWGYPFFEEMKTKSNKKKQEWAENRSKAYYGSAQHFFQSLTENKLTEEGFVMHRLIRQQKKLFNVPLVPEKKDSLGNIVNVASKEIITVDSTDIKLKEEKSLRKISTNGFSNYVQFLVKTPLRENEISRQHEDIFQLDFTDLLYVVYSREFEEQHFLSFGQKNVPQTSILSMLEPPALIEKNGHLINPLSVIFEGRWGNEKIGELLPLDYQPQTP